MGHRALVPSPFRIACSSLAVQDNLSRIRGTVRRSAGVPKISRA